MLAIVKIYRNGDQDVSLEMDEEEKRDGSES